MGHIKEPHGVDFIINSRPLTKKEEEGISAFIKAYKAKNARKQIGTKTATRKTKMQEKSMV